MHRAETTTYAPQKYKSEWQVQSQSTGVPNGLLRIQRYSSPLLNTTNFPRESLSHKSVQGNLQRSYRRVISPLQLNTTAIHESIQRSLQQLLLHLWRGRTPLVNMDDYSLKLSNSRNLNFLSRKVLHLTLLKETKLWMNRCISHVPLTMVYIV